MVLTLRGGDPMAALGKSFSAVLLGQPAPLAANGFALLLIHGGPLAHSLSWCGFASGLPRASQTVLNGCHDFRAGDIPPALGCLNFEQADDLTGWQVRVKLTSYPK